eukprot:CAMPEP_0178400136 /NCGR_PEP_ID=MMETSP0689_2-20121128/15634_1 /TAXON_ID=160604 /ORGANISM="Amphidinium massartii, Strain CS-259" /LENGTH=141 /DNA_ID=CAMNT_0020020923 /DNA_START=49 /DNA_END=474 /DNA_ORIENTATION=+
MARAVVGVAFVCMAVVLTAPLTFTASSGAARGAQLTSTPVSLRGQIADASVEMPAAEASSASCFQPFMAACLAGLMFGLVSSPTAAFAEFTKVPAKAADKVSGKAPTQKERLAKNLEKIAKAKKSKTATYSDTSEAARVFA